MVHISEEAKLFAAKYGEPIEDDDDLDEVFLKLNSIIVSPIGMSKDQQYLTEIGLMAQQYYDEVYDDIEVKSPDSTLKKTYIL